MLPYVDYLPPHGLFISHAWDYRSEYDGVVDLLNSDSSFRWKNLSVPIDDPLQLSDLLPKSHRNIVRQLDERISRADCVLVLAGMYVAHRGWIQSEIEAAQDYHKPIIAVTPRGQERFPDALRQTADQVVGWKSKSIIEAVRKLSSQGKTSLAQLAGISPTLSTLPSPPNASFSNLRQLAGISQLPKPPEYRATLASIASLVPPPKK